MELWTWAKEIDLWDEKTSAVFEDDELMLFDMKFDLFNREKEG